MADIDRFLALLYGARESRVGAVATGANGTNFAPPCIEREFAWPSAAAEMATWILAEDAAGHDVRVIAVPISTGRSTYPVRAALSLEAGDAAIPTDPAPTMAIEIEAGVHQLHYGLTMPVIVGPEQQDERVLLVLQRLINPAIGLPTRGTAHLLRPPGTQNRLAADFAVAIAEEDAEAVHDPLALITGSALGQRLGWDSLYSPEVPRTPPLRSPLEVLMTRVGHISSGVG